MYRIQNYFVAFIVSLVATACSDTNQKVTKEQAAAFSVVMENSVSAMKIDFLETNIIAPIFINKIYEATKLKSSDRMESEVKAILRSNQSEKSIYDLMAGDGSFKKVKQYEKDGNQRIIFRAYGSGGLSYLDMELAMIKNKVGIADMFLYNTGQNLSASLGDLLKKL